MCLFLCLRTLLCCDYRYLLPNTCCCCCYLDCGCIFLGLVMLISRIIILVLVHFFLKPGSFDVIEDPNISHISVIVMIIGCIIPIFLLVGAICGCYQCVYVFVSMECLWYPGFLLWFYFVFNSEAGDDQIGWILWFLLTFLKSILLWILNYVLMFLTVLELYLLLLSCSLYDALLCIYGNPDDYGPPYVVVA